MPRRRRPKIPYYMRPLTEAQLRAETNRRVAGILGPQRAELEKQSASRIATIRAASEAASSLLASHAGITQSGYHQATEDLKGLGGGYSSEMLARMGAAKDAASSFLSAQGQEAPAAGTDVSALGDTVKQGGMTIPGSSLVSQGAAATALENEQSGIPLLQGTQDIRQNMQESEQALKDLAAKRPELRAQIMDELYKREMQKLQARIQERAQSLYESQFREKTAYDQARVNQARLNYLEQVRYHDAAISKAQAEGRNPNASLSKAYGYIVDAKGNPILDHDGNKIPVAKSANAKGQKQKANAQYSKAVGEAKTMYEATRPGPADQYGDPTAPKREWRWANALRYLMNRYGINRARARKALIAGGFRPPGRGPGGTGPR